MKMTFEPERKKAKTEHENSSTVVGNRVKELHEKILALRDEYPELTCIDQNRLHGCLDEAFVKYKSEQHCPIYKLPNEILQKCFEFVDDGSYLFTATVSKNFHNAHMAKFASRKGRKKTSYRYGACSTSLAKYCVQTLCKTQDEIDQIFIAGAVNGNLEILEYALEEGNDLLPIINCFAFEDILFRKSYFEKELLEVLIGSPNEGSSSKPSSIARIAREGHLHVLKYLYEKVNFRMGMQLASYEAIRNGHLDIVEWLHSIGYLEELRTLHEYGGFDIQICFCDQSCPAKVLKWLIENGYYNEINHDEDSPFYYNLLELADKDLLDCCLSKGVEFDEEAIDSLARLGNVEFAEYCQEKGLRMTSDAYFDAIKSGSLEMVKFLHRSGIPFRREYTRDAVRNGHLEMLKFARENGCPWHDKTSIVAAYSKNLEMLQYLHTNGCPWHPGTLYGCLLIGEKNAVETLPTIEVFRFLHEKGCPWDKRFSQKIIEMKDTSLLRYMHESGLPYENDLLEVALRWEWLDGVKYIIESKMRCKRPACLEYVVSECHDLKILKYLKSTGMKWGAGMESDSENISVFVEIVSSYSYEFQNRLEVFQWAIESGCPLDEPEEIFYYAFHMWLADPSNRQKRDILSYLQKRGVPQGNIFDKYHI